MEVKRRIRKVAVLGSGVMGSRLACHFANIGLEVLLLDIVPTPTQAQLDSGLNINKSEFRNQIVDNSLKQTIQSNPNPLFSKKYLSRISTGNFEDNLKDIADCDWVLEAIIENPEIKQKLYTKVETFRKAGSLITSNTSGIPIHRLIEGRSDDFKKNFCGTHFFNPPRYLELLEIIPSPETDSSVIDFFLDFGERYLGKTTVLAKDTPAFIANRVGVFSILLIFQLMEKTGLSIEEIDAITGTVVGRPKSATFRTCDVVGLDTLVKVADNLYKDCPTDESRAFYKVPDFILKMVDLGLIGDKKGKGFYQKTRSENGSEIKVLNLSTFEYESLKKPRIPVVSELKAIDDLKSRIKKLYSTKDTYGRFTKAFYDQLFAYASHRIPEISDDIYLLDNALKAGFGWELGVFEIWDLVKYNPETTAEIPVSNWASTMFKQEKPSFYTTENGKKYFYEIESKKQQTIPGIENLISLESLRKDKVIWSNNDSSVFDLGDGILCLEFHSKMNTMGAEVIQGLHKAIDLAEKQYEGLVIGNEGSTFSAGANLALILMMALEQEWDELDFAISTFQKAMMRARYSSIPVVVAPRSLSIGGGCELTLHADAVQAHAESYIGLVEAGAGLIPSGGGTKEFVLRTSDGFFNGDPELPSLNENFMTIAMAKVSTSAQEAMELGFLKKGRDRISINRTRHLTDAKNLALELVTNGYTMPIERTDIKALGRTALGGMLTGAYAMQQANYISEFDLKIAQKLAYVMAGGDLTESQLVSETYLLNLERDAFLSLLGERKTVERIQHLLKTGKPLRN